MFLHHIYPDPYKLSVFHEAYNSTYDYSKQLPVHYIYQPVEDPTLELSMHHIYQPVKISLKLSI